MTHHAELRHLAEARGTDRKIFIQAVDGYFVTDEVSLDLDSFLALLDAAERTDRATELLREWDEGAATEEIAHTYGDRLRAFLAEVDRAE